MSGGPPVSPALLSQHFLSLVLSLFFPSSFLPLLFSLAISPPLLLSSLCSPLRVHPSTSFAFLPLSCSPWMSLPPSVPTVTSTLTHLCLVLSCLSVSLCLSIIFCLRFPLCLTLPLFKSPKAHWLLWAVPYPVPSAPTSGNHYSGLERNPTVPQTYPQAAHGDQMATDSSRN